MEESGELDISLIICTRDRAEHLRLTLQSLAQVRVPDGCSAELLVVDNGSTDGTADLVRETRLPHMAVRSLCETQPGLSRARNAGLAASSGRIIVFTDDDIRFPADWLDGMCGPILAGRADAVAGGVRTAPALERPWMTAGHPARLASTERLDPAAPDVMVGANMAFSRNVLDRVPGFDVELGAGALGFGEETLFSWQLREAGFRLVSAFDVTVEHHFAPDRLLRASLLKMAAAQGCAGGYLARHWTQDPIPVPAVRLAKCRLWLRLWRLCHPRSLTQVEGASATELTLLEKVTYLEQYRRELKRPPRYDRRGLVPRSR